MIVRFFIISRTKKMTLVRKKIEKKFSLVVDVKKMEEGFMSGRVSSCVGQVCEAGVKKILTPEIALDIPAAAAMEVMTSCWE